MAARLAPADAWDNALWPKDVQAQAGRSRAARALRSLGLRGGPARAAVRGFVRSRLLQHLDRSEEAAAEFTAARPLLRGCRWYYHGRLGELLVKGGRMRKAAAHLRRASALDPSKARPRCWRAEALYWLGDARGAARGFDEAVRCEPDNAGVAAWRGQFLLWAGRYAEAARALEGALSLDPRYAWAHAWLGAARMLSGDPVRGLSDIERGLSLDPRDLEGRLYRAECLLRLGRRAAARRELAAAARLEPHRPWLHVLRALDAAESGRPQAALGAYRRARALMPDRLPELERPDAKGLKAVVASFYGCRVYRPVR